VSKNKKRKQNRYQEANALRQVGRREENEKKKEVTDNVTSLLGRKEWKPGHPDPNPGDIVLLDPTLFVDKRGNLLEDAVNDTVRSENIDHPWAKDLGRKIREEGQKVEASVVFMNGYPKMLKGAHRTTGCFYEGLLVAARVLDRKLVPTKSDQIDAGMIDNFDTQEKKVSTLLEEENWAASKLKDDPDIWEKIGIERTPNKPNNDADAVKYLDYIKGLCDPESGENRGKYTKLSKTSLKKIIRQHRANETLLTKGLHAPQNPTVISQLPNMMKEVGITLDSESYWEYDDETDTYKGSISGLSRKAPDPTYEGNIIHRVDPGKDGGGLGHLCSYMLSREKFPLSKIYLLCVLKFPSSLSDLISKRHGLLDAYEQKQDVYELHGDKKPYDGIYFYPQRKSGNFLNSGIAGIAEEPNDRLVTAAEVRKDYQVLQKLGIAKKTK
jgi:hypothetical protein